MNNAARTVFHLACPNFTANEAEALKSVLGLIKPYLKQLWELAEGASGDLLLVNLDLGYDRPSSEATCVVGCALRPRLHPPSTLHRPIRVPELLAILTDVGEQQSQRGKHRADLVKFRYQLRMWPLDIERWPSGCLRVLATICGANHSADEIAELTELPMADVKACLLKLKKLELIDRYAMHVDQPPRIPHAFRSLARRVGQILGFRQ